MKRYQRIFWFALGLVVLLRGLVHFISDPLISIYARNFFNEARSVAAALACFVAARATRSVFPKLSRAWFVISISFLGWIIGIFLHFITELHSTSVVGTFVDLPYLAFYPVFLFGVLQLPTPRRTRDEWLSLTFDLAIALFAAFLMVWTLAIRQKLEHSSSLDIAEMSTLAYAFGDVLLIWGAFYILVVPTRTLARGVRNVLALGAIFLFVTDLLYSWLVQHGRYQTTSIIGLGWTLGLASFAVGGSLAWNAPENTEPEASSSGGWLQLSGAVSIVLSTLCMAVSLLVAWSSPASRNDVVTICLVGALFALVIGRQLTGARKVARLRAMLLDANLSLEERVRERTKQLETERDRTAAVLSSVQEAILIHDLNSRFIDVNPSMLRMFGMTREQALNLGVRDISGDPQADPDQIWQNLAPGESIRFNWLARRLNGETFPTEVVLTNFMYNTEPAIAASVRDMSDQQRIQEQLLRSQRLEAIGRLAGGVAHDFNNLLVPILGYAQLLLLTTPPDTPDHEQLLEINEAAVRAKELTQQLLSFGRKAVLEVTVFNLNTVIVDFEKILRRLLREDITLDLNLGEGVGNISGDRGQIEQVLMNLVVNARDASPSGGRITIATLNTLDQGAPPSRPEVLLTVTDTGIGMSEAVQDRLFEPFFTTKEVGRGTGLGLATVFGIVRQHSGTIRVKSKEGEGSTFTVTLPRVDQEVTKQREPLGRCLRGSGKILLVEDNEGVRLFTSRALRHHGYDVHATGSPTEALRLIAQPTVTIDLILSDVVMPEMNSRVFIDNAKNLRPKLQVLLMSGYASELISAIGATDGSLPLIQKPFAAQELAAKVQELLGRGA